ncbi:MAG TPA: TetR/AcrR family transcriptional regulator [Longimicrobiales bacterium]
MRRTTASDETRARILEATRDLAVEEGFSRFTIEKVAARAGVSRMTVYYQFGSKAELLEALFDHLAERGRLERLGEAFRDPDPLSGLERFIEVFSDFWASDPVGIRRLRSWAALEPGYEKSGYGRDAWQRQGLEVLVGRIREVYGVPAAEAVADVVDLLHALLSPESHAKLSRSGRSPEEVAALLKRAAWAVLGVGDRRGTGGSAGSGGGA